MILYVEQPYGNLEFFTRSGDLFAFLCKPAARIIFGKRALKTLIRKVRVTASTVPSEHSRAIKVTRRFVTVDRTFFVLALKGTLYLYFAVSDTKKLLQGAWPKIRKLGNGDSIKVYLTVEVLA